MKEQLGAWLLASPENLAKLNIQRATTIHIKHSLRKLCDFGKSGVVPEDGAQDPTTTTTTAITAATTIATATVATAAATASSTTTSTPSPSSVSCGRAWPKRVLQLEGPFYRAGSFVDQDQVSQVHEPT